MPIPTWTVGEVLTSSDVNTWFVPLVAFKGTDQSVTSNTTLQNDTALAISLAANATYHFVQWLNYEGGTQGSSDLKVGWTVPSGATMKGSATYVNASGGATVEVYATNAGTLAAGTNGGGSIRGFRLIGSIVTSSTAANFQVQWCQNTSSGTATTVHAGSFLSAQRIG